MPSTALNVAPKLRQLTLLLLVLMLGACATSSLLPVKPEVSVQSIRLGKIGISEQELIFGLSVNNSNRFSIPISGSNFKATFGGQQVASGSTQQDLVLGASGTTIVPLIVKSQIIKSMGDLGRALTSGTLNLDYTIEGQLDVDLAVFPFGIPFKLNGNVADDFKNFRR